MKGRKTCLHHIFIFFEPRKIFHYQINDLQRTQKVPNTKNTSKLKFCGSKSAPENGSCRAQYKYICLDSTIKSDSHTNVMKKVSRASRGIASRA